ncbi:MAG: ATP phosphoribosyltransferase [Rickettsiales bacterium]|nr:ATP phosphoribosyltransferase [Rickettsiales bacterium]
MTDKKLILAVPKGRILSQLLPVLKRAGIEPEAKFFDPKDRSLRFASNVPELDIIRVRSFDVPSFVAYGGAQLGIGGSDVLAEFDYPDLYTPLDLDLGKCRMSVAMLEDEAKDENPQNWSHIRVGTKYPHITRSYFAKRGVQAECIKLNGAMELAPSLGLCKRIVDLVETGSTLVANGLVEVETIMEVSSRLIVNRPAYKTDGERVRSLIDQFAEALDG